MTVEASSVPGVFASVCPSRQNDRWVSHPHSLCRSRPAGPETFCIRSGVPSEQGQGRDPKPGRLLPGPLPLCAAVTFVLRVWHPHIRAGAAGWLRLWGGQRCDPRSPGASFLMSAAMTVTGWDAPRGECFAHSRCPVRVCRPACSRPPPSSSPPPAPASSPLPRGGPASVDFAMENHGSEVRRDTRQEPAGVCAACRELRCHRGAPSAEEAARGPPWPDRGCQELRSPAVSLLSPHCSQKAACQVPRLTRISCASRVKAEGETEACG